MATPTASVSAIEHHEGGAPATTVEETPQVRFAVEPLLAHLGENWASEARARGMSPVEVGTLLRSLNRARGGAGLTARAADRLAVRAAGVHPSAIWGIQWFTAADCGGPGVCTATDCCEPDDTGDDAQMCD